MDSIQPQLDASQSRLGGDAAAKRLRAALLLVFGGLLALMVLAGAGALVTLRRLHTAEQEVSSRFLRHTQALSTVVISVHIYDDQLARFLLDDSAANETTPGREITDHAETARSALQHYPLDGGPIEQQLLQEMEEELAAQENTSAAFLSLSPGDRKARSREFIHEQLLPRSLTILQVSQQMASLNSQQLARGTQELLAGFESLQMRLRSMLVVALTAGLLLSVVGSFYVLRLERQGQERYRALADSRLELEKLSARLVDAQEQERRSIARELHDEVGQSLEALLVDVGRLSRLVPAGEQVMGNQIARVKGLAENSVKTVRDITLLLRPSMLDDLGLIPALEWQARETSRRGDMEVDVHSEDVSEQLPDEIKTCAYRLVQEALNNAAAHASAKNARVDVVQTNDKLRVQITDDGKGFDAQRVRGVGLIGMEERVKRLGGTLKIDSSAGQGTTVAAELPVPMAQSS
jgi:signal transduction histidine kinase